MPLKSWFVYRVNCDCAAYLMARRRRPSSFLRCRSCGRTLGDLQAEFLGNFKAASESEAINKAKPPQKSMKKNQIVGGGQYTDNKGGIREVLAVGSEYTLYPTQANRDNLRYKLVAKKRGPLTTGGTYNCTRGKFASWAKARVDQPSSEQNTPLNEVVVKQVPNEMAPQTTQPLPNEAGETTTTKPTP